MSSLPATVLSILDVLTYIIVTPPYSGTLFVCCLYKWETEALKGSLSGPVLTLEALQFELFAPFTDQALKD